MESGAVKMIRYIGYGLLGVTMCFLFWRIAHDTQRPEEILQLKKTDQSIRPSKMTRISDILSEVNKPEHQSRAIDSAQSLGTEKGKKLLASDARELLGFLQNGKPSIMSDEEWEERVNIVLNSLREYGAAYNGELQGLSDFLLHLSEDQSGRVLQLYALQHMGQWIPVIKDRSERQTLLDRLSAISADVDHPAAGTAVLMLSDLVDDQVGVDEKFVVKASIEMVSNASLNHDVRISAIHSCIDRNVKEILPFAQMIASDKTANAALRKAAIHSLGQLGGEVEKEFLITLGDNNDLITPAVKSSLEILQKKQQVK